MPSTLPVATRLPLGLTPTASTCPVCPASVTKLLERVRIANARSFWRSASAADETVDPRVHGDHVSNAVMPPIPLARSCKHARGGECVVEGLLGLCKHAAVVAPGHLRGFDREQDAQLRIHLEIRLRGGGQLARRREPGVVLAPCCGERAQTLQEPSAAAASAANPASIARRRRARRRAAASAAGTGGDQVLALTCGHGEVGTHPPTTRTAPAGPRRGRYSGSRPVSCHSATASTSRRRRRRSPRRSSIQRVAVPTGTGSPRARPRQSASDTAARGRR